MKNYEKIIKNVTAKMSYTQHIKSRQNMKNIDVLHLC